jgi:hypothetical protein
MKTDKKNQHYIPKFYLKNFSYQNNKKQIGIFNLKSSFFYQRSKLKSQGSKNFFYGYDGVIEDWLSEIEGHLATFIRDINESLKPPKKHSEKHIELLAFINLTYLRNPVQIENIKASREQVKKRLLELDPTVDVNKFIPEVSHESAIDTALSGVKDAIENTSDLAFKLLINKTSIPFISSDFPIVKYNQFLEERKWQHGKTGLGLMGLQIFVPINPELIIILYDSETYKVGTKKSDTLEITSRKDVDQFNSLQILNCIETVFFNEQINEHYIRGLYDKCKGLPRPNQSKSQVSFIADKEGDSSKLKKENLIIVGTTDCEIKLNVNGIKQLSSARNRKLDNRVAQMRKHPEKIRRQRDGR